jgi:hypothetical protein
MNVVDELLGKSANALEGRERLIAIHGNRFILFRVFSQIDLGKLRAGTAKLEDLKTECEKLTRNALNAVVPAINTKFPDAYPGNIFKNQDRQAELLDSITSSS